jgi:hypothetical protein
VVVFGVMCDVRVRLSRGEEGWYGGMSCLWWDGFDGQVGKVLIERYCRASQGMAWIA